MSGTKKTIDGRWTRYSPNPGQPPYETRACYVPLPEHARDMDAIELGAADDGSGEWTMGQADGVGLTKLWVPASEMLRNARTEAGTTEKVFVPMIPVAFEGPRDNGEWVDCFVAANPRDPRRGLRAVRAFRPYSSEDFQASEDGRYISGAEALRRLPGRSYSYLKSAVIRGTIGHHRRDGRDFYNAQDVADVAAGIDPKLRKAAEEREYEASMRSAWGEVLPEALPSSGPATPRDAAMEIDPVDAFVQRHVRGDR